MPERRRTRPGGRTLKGGDFPLSELAALGAQGWELVAVTSDGNGVPGWFYFKRPKPVATIPTIRHGDPRRRRVSSASIAFSRGHPPRPARPPGCG